MKDQLRGEVLVKATFLESFENLILAKEKINNDVLTSLKWVRKTNTDEGEKIYYGCKSKGCFVGLNLNHENEHSHDGIPENNRNS